MRHGLITTMAIFALLATTAPVAEDSPTSTLRGKLRDADGRPVEGARVRLLRTDMSMQRRHLLHERWVGPTVLRTDADGRFAAAELTEPTYRIRVEAADHAPTTLDDIPVGAAVTIHLKRGHPVAGSVVDAASGDPLAGATVTACDPAALDFGRDACAGATTDDEGRFTLAHAPEGRLYLRASAPGHAVSAVASLDVPANEDDPGPVLPLARGARIEGRVVDGQRPLEGVSISAVPLARSMSDLRLQPQWPDLSGPDGSFVLEGVRAPARYTLRGERADRGPGQSVPLTLEPGDLLEDVTIRMAAPALLRLRLVDPEDRPVQRFDLHHKPSEDGSASYGRPLRPSWISRLEDGGFEARIPEPGRLDLLLVPDDHAEVERTDVMLRSGETTDLGTIEVEPGEAVFGTVANVDGEPLPDAIVEARWSVDRRPRKRDAQVDAEGNYRLAGLGETPVGLTVRARGYVTERRQEVVPGERIDFYLEPTGGIEGRVRTDEGEPPAAFRILVHTETKESAGGFSRPAPRDQGFATEDGSFRVGDLGAGTYTVEARADGYAPTKVSGIELESGRTARAGTIVLEPGLLLKGRVLRLEGDAPILGARIDALERVTQTFGLDESPLEATASDETGSFELRSLGPGAYRVRAEHGEFAPKQVEIVLQSETPPEELVLRLSQGGTLTGTVLGPDRLPREGSKILATTSLADLGSARQALTDLEGRYEIRRLDPGSYQVSCVRGRDLETKPGVIREGEVTVVDFGGESRIRLRGQVLRGDEPVAGASLFFTDPDTGFSLDGMRHTESDADGRFEVELDGPGSYRVMVGEGTAGGSSVDIVVPDEPEIEQDILLGRDGIAGTVFDVEGRPLAGASVTAVLDGTAGDLSSMLFAETDRQGRFWIQGASEGIYKLTAVALGHEPAVLYPIELLAGLPLEGVDFHLEPGRLLRGVVLDGQGRGIAGAYVFAAPSGSLDAMAAATGESDVNGSFGISVPNEGPIDVTAISAGWAPARLTGFLPPDDPDGPPVTLQVTPGGVLSVQVTGTDGDPRPGVPIVVRASPGFLASEFAMLLNPVAPTDAAGQASIGRLAPGAYEVLIPGSAGATSTPVVVQEGRTSRVLVELP